VSAVRFRASAFFNLQASAMNKNLKRVIADIATHLSLALIGSAVIYFWFRDVFYALSFFMGSVFIDLDHFVDCFLHFGLRFSLKDFFGLEYLRSGKVYMFLHSWELFAVIFSISIIFDITNLFFFSLALAIHLLFDTLHRVKPLFYCLIYRASKGFNARDLCPECLENLI
jgi:hypothetical protein